MIRTFVLAALFGGTLWSTTASAAPGDVVATVEGQSILLSDVDRAGGRHVYDMAHELYAARVQSLYGLLSERLLEVEAAAQGISAEALRKREITDKSGPLSDADIDAVFASNTTLSRHDTRAMKRVKLYLKVKARKDRKARYMGQLIEKYNVQVALNAPPPPPAEEIHGDFAPLLGRPDAPVEIVSFSDYQCPYCRQYELTLAAVQARFPNDVKIVNRHFPIRDDGKKLAEAALCAEEQGRYLDYHNALFDRPNVSSAQVMDVAASLGLDREAFGQCYHSSRHAGRVTEDVEEGQRLVIRGTPTSFVNGHRLAGRVEMQTLVSRIEAELARLEDS